MKKSNRCIILVTAFILMLLAGLIFAWSIFVEPIENELGVTRSQTSVVFTITLSISIIGQIFAGYIINRKSPKLLFLIAAILLFFGFIFASRLNTIGELYIYFGVFCGFGIGIIYNTVMTIVIKSYQDKPGLASGVTLMGFGLSGLILGSLSANFMVLFGWRKTFILFGFLFGICSLLASVIMKIPEDINDNSNNQINSIIENIPPQKMIKSKNFIMFFLWSVLFTSSSILIISHSALCAYDIGASVKVAALATGVISIFNGLSRLVFGKIYDIWSHRVSINILFIVILSATILIIISYSTSSIFLLFLGYALIGISYGGGPPTINSFIKDMFGIKYFGINLGIANLQMAFSSLLGSLVAGTIRTHFGTYLPAFYLMLVFVVLSFLFSFGTVKKASSSLN